jgi:DNA segregation ATPase FtsK/SpoIIIE-like protein
MKHPHPLRVINYTELAFAFVAHVITIPILGVLTGLICGCAVLYTIRIQADAAKPRTSRAAFYGTLAFKTGQLWIHQTSFLFIFTWSGKTLPFGWSLDSWAWITTAFIFIIDIWALYTTAQEAKEQAAEVIAANAHEEQQNREERAERERKAQRERDSQERIELARIRAEHKTTAKLAAEETERKRLENERITAELKWKAEEDARKLAEAKWKAEEDARKLAEQERKETERVKKEEEQMRKAAELEQTRREEAEKKKQREIWRLQKQNRKINHSLPVEAT